jgi:hypothetical protein
MNFMPWRIYGATFLRWSSYVATVLSGLFLVGCATVISYKEPFRTETDVSQTCQAYSSSDYGWNANMIGGCDSCDASGKCFFIADLEYDEDGKRFARHIGKSFDQRGALVEWLNASKEPVAMVVFIHGWHHNASDNSGNRKNFGYLVARYKETIRRLHMANGLPLSSVPKVVGVYVGWPGEQYSGFLNFLTIGNRASMADKVGAPGGDLTLDLKVLRNAVTSAGNGSTHSPMNGAMLVMGHSLGGRVLVKAFAPELEVGVSQPLGTRSLVLTMEAAVGADYFAKVMDSTERNSETTENPHWLNIASIDDRALDRPYSMGLAFGLIPKNDKSHPGSHQTLGLYDAYVTHRLGIERIDGCQGGKGRVHPDFRCPRNDHLVPAAGSNPFPWVQGFNAAREVERSMALYFHRQSKGVGGSNAPTLEPNNADLYVLSLKKTPVNPLRGRLWNVLSTKDLIWSTEEGRSYPDHNGYITTIGIRMAVEAMWNDGLLHPPTRLSIGAQ